MNRIYRIFVSPRVPCRSVFGEPQNSRSITYLHRRCNRDRMLSSPLSAKGLSTLDP